jgi:hypothetical protein
MTGNLVEHFFLIGFSCIIVALCLLSLKRFLPLLNVKIKNLCFRSMSLYVTHPKLWLFLFYVVPMSMIQWCIYYHEIITPSMEGSIASSQVTVLENVIVSENNEVTAPENTKSTTSSITYLVIGVGLVVTLGFAIYFMTSWFGGSPSPSPSPGPSPSISPSSSISPSISPGLDNNYIQTLDDSLNAALAAGGFTAATFIADSLYSIEDIGQELNSLVKDLFAHKPELAFVNKQDKFTNKTWFRAMTDYLYPCIFQQSKLNESFFFLMRILVECLAKAHNPDYVMDHKRLYTNVKRMLLSNKHASKLFIMPLEHVQQIICHIPWDATHYPLRKSSPLVRKALVKYVGIVKSQLKASSK